MEAISQCPPTIDLNLISHWLTSLSIPLLIWCDSSGPSSVFPQVSSSQHLPDLTAVDTENWIPPQITFSGLSIGNQDHTLYLCLPSPWRKYLVWGDCLWEVWRPPCACLARLAAWRMSKKRRTATRAYTQERNLKQNIQNWSDRCHVYFLLYLGWVFRTWRYFPDEFTAWDDLHSLSIRWRRLFRLLIDTGLRPQREIYTVQSRDTQVLLMFYTFF